MFTLEEPEQPFVSVGVLPERASRSHSSQAMLDRRLNSLSVVLPAYNEEAVIKQTLAQVSSVLARLSDDFEIIVVNDGSSDGTKGCIEHIARQDSHIRLLNHTSNRGYGATLVSGFHAVTKDFVFFMDSDGQFDINDLAHFLPLIGSYDAVLGYRSPRRDPWLRRFNAWGWKQLVRLVFDVRVRDIDCAFKLYRASFLRTLDLETRGAMINTEIMYKFKHEEYTYAEVAVRHLPRARGKATGAKPAVILRALREMYFFARKWRQEKQLRPA